jgi:hypothetical protein
MAAAYLCEHPCAKTKINVECTCRSICSDVEKKQTEKSMLIYIRFRMFDHKHVYVLKISGNINVTEVYRDFHIYTNKCEQIELNILVDDTWFSCAASKKQCKYSFQRFTSVKREQSLFYIKTMCHPV